MHTNYRLVLEVQWPGGDVIHRETLVPDWEPAVEWTRLAGLRRHGVWQQASDPEPELEPRWHKTAGEPMLRGFSVRMTRTGTTWAEEFEAVRYFAEYARAVAAGRVAEGQLAAGERVQYAISAYGIEERDERPVVTPIGFDTATRPQPLVIRDRAFPSALAASQPSGETHPFDLPVMVPEHVIEEVRELTREAGDRETGGVLLGHLCKDDGPSGVGVEVTAQIPARHTVGDAVKLTFTSETWTDIRAAVALRGGQELLVGWWHSHPSRAWCSKCPIERQRVCQFTTGFLSADDRAMHRTMFPGAFSLALVVTNSVIGLETKLFGWRTGVLEARGFHVKGNHATTPALPH